MMALCSDYSWGGGKSLVSLYVDSVLVGSNNSNTSNEGGSITCFAAKKVL